MLARTMPVTVIDDNTRLARLYFEGSAELAGICDAQ